MTEAAAFWDAEFSKGRYAESAPIGFTTEIVTAAREASAECTSSSPPTAWSSTSR